MNTIGIDPGSTESALVEWDGKRITCMAIEDNVRTLHRLSRLTPGPEVAIEQVRGYGITAGNELFDTCIWTGRFQQQLIGSGFICSLVPRKTVVTHLCDHSKAGDKEIRQALIDRIGPQGSKKEPGPTYGMAGHLWAALAVAVYAYDQHLQEPHA